MEFIHTKQEQKQKQNQERIRLCKRKSNQMICEFSVSVCPLSVWQFPFASTCSPVLSFRFGCLGHRYIFVWAWSLQLFALSHIFPAAQMKGNFRQLLICRLFHNRKINYSILLRSLEHTHAHSASFWPALISIRMDEKLSPATNRLSINAEITQQSTTRALFTQIDTTH